ncbi:alpha/beta hydrolase [Naumannella huperziae]
MPGNDATETRLSELDLDPAVHTWLARETELRSSLPDLTAPDPAVQRAAARRLSDRLAVIFTAEAPAGVAIADAWLPATGGAALRVRCYRPDGISDRAPAQLFLHGGGFVHGSPDELVNDRLLAARALAAGLVIFSLDYRLAPEHPYPAALSDAVAAWLELTEAADRLRIDPARIGVGGSSAGGTLAAGTTLALRDRHGLVPTHQALEVPAAAVRPYGRSGELYGDEFGAAAAHAVVPLYLPGGTGRYAEPLDVPDLTGLPPTLIMTAEHDFLRDGAEEYGARLAAAGADVCVLRGAGHLHGTPALTATMAGAREWQENCAAALRDAYHTERSPR